MSRINEAYTVTIASVKSMPNAAPVFVQAPMPESFMYDAQVMYEAPFTQGLTGNAAIDTVMKVGFAAKLVTHAMTAQFWQGSTETDLGLELEFHAETDPISEVRDPVVSLLRLTTPAVRDGMLASPGPQLSSQIMQDILTAGVSGSMSVPAGTKGEVSQGQMTNTQQSVAQGATNNSKTTQQSVTIGTVDYFKSRIENQISIKIGKYAFFDSVVITSVQKTVESQFNDLSGLPFYTKVAVRFKPLFMVTQDDLDKIFGITSSSPVYSQSATPIGTQSLSPTLGPNGGDARIDNGWSL